MPAESTSNTKTITAAQMKEFDRYTIEVMGVPSMVLMERAALAVIAALYDGGFDLSHTLCVCGTGNNGGDGMAVARLLHVAGHDVEIVLVGDESRLSTDARAQLTIAHNYGVLSSNFCFENVVLDTDTTTVVDALFGIGLSREVDGAFRQAIEAINAWRIANAPQGRTLSVDIPSGINADSGEVLGCAVKADATVTFAYSKKGLVTEPGATYTGSLTVADIGIYEPVE